MEIGEILLKKKDFLPRVPLRRKASQKNEIIH
jgi:hypothetical protein